MAIKQIVSSDVLQGSNWPANVSHRPEDVSESINALNSRVVSLTSTQILGMNASPVSLIPAQGTNKIVLVDEILFEMNRTATAYAAGGAVEFRYTNASGAKVSADIAATVVTTGGAGTEYNHIGGVVSSLTPVANAAIVITNATAAFTTGTGTARVFLRYRVIDTVAVG